MRNIHEHFNSIKTQLYAFINENEQISIRQTFGNLCNFPRPLKFNIRQTIMYAIFFPCPGRFSLRFALKRSEANQPLAAAAEKKKSPDSRTQTKDKRFIELASTKNDFQAERRAHSSTEAEDNGHRMEGWAKRAPLTTGSAEKRRRGDQQGTQVSLPRNTQMFVPCPRLVLERTSSASLLGVKRASGADLPCAADFVYTLSPDSRTQTKDNLHFSLIFSRNRSSHRFPAGHHHHDTAFTPFSTALHAFRQQISRRDVQALRHTAAAV